MNIFSKRRALCNLLLLGALVSPGLALADADTVQAINQMDANVTGRLDGSKEILQKILDKNDISNKDMVTAILNYLAKESIQRYGLEEQKMLQVAPGTLWASKAGADAGGLYFQKIALDITNRSMINSIGLLSDQQQISIGDVKVDFTDAPAYGALELYRQMSGFFVGGDTSKLKSINAGTLLQTTSLAAADISPQEGQQLVNMLTNPFPVHDSEITAKLKAGTKIDGSEMEKLGQLLAQYAVVGVSANAWADIVARRSNPTDSTGKPIANSSTVMQIMEKTSNDRFTSSEWYAAIGAASEAALLREIAHMMAYNQWVQYQQFRMSEQQVSLLASLNGIMAKINTSIDIMNIELAKARAEAELQAKNAQKELDEQKAAAEQQLKDAKDSASSTSSGGG